MAEVGVAVVVLADHLDDRAQGVGPGVAGERDGREEPDPRALVAEGVDQGVEQVGAIPGVVLGRGGDVADRLEGLGPDLLVVVLRHRLEEAADPGVAPARLADGPDRVEPGERGRLGVPGAGHQAF